MGQTVIQMPEDNLVMATPKKVDPQVKWLVQKLHTAINCNGEEVQVAKIQKGAFGFMLIFHEYDDALKWSNNQPENILQMRVG